MPPSIFSSAILEKVVALITRQRNGQTELLVFDHPTAGTQIPAGTVEAEEPITTAVVREAFEETGCHADIVRQLAPPTFDPLTPKRCIALSRFQPRQTPSPSGLPARPDWYASRGLPFEIVDYSSTESPFVYAVRREYDHNQTPSKLIDERYGWIPRQQLTRRQRRHYFLMHLSNRPSTETWTHIGDHGVPWRLYWTPLTPRPVLIHPQNNWLDYVIDCF